MCDGTLAQAAWSGFMRLPKLEVGLAVQMPKNVGLVVIALAVGFAGLSCVNHTSGGDMPGGQMPGDTPGGDSDAVVTVDLANLTPYEAESLLRPSVTADGIGVSPIADTFDGFLSDNDQRVGRILYDGIDDLLRTLPAPPNTNSELSARLATLDQIIIGPIIAAGGSVLLNLECPMPDFLSQREGFLHDVLSGENVPTANTVSSCSPPKGDTMSRGLWAVVVGAVAEYFGSRYGDGVIYLLGREPESYFVGDLAAFLDTYQLTAEG
ncbi:MAG: hypothetical protein AAB426_05285, partial [Myxococcota bacterium]